MSRVRAGLLACMLACCGLAQAGAPPSPVAPASGALVGAVPSLPPLISAIEGGEPLDRILALLDQQRTGSIGDSVAISPDGHTLATGTSGGWIRLWDLASGRERARLQGHDGPVTSVAFSPDGKTLASSSGGDKTVRLWDLASGRERARLQGHDNWVISVAFSPDGKTLASGSVDKTVRLWDLASGQWQTLLAHGANAQWLVCQRARQLCERADDGSWLLMSLAGSAELVAFKPAGTAQPIEVTAEAVQAPLSGGAGAPVELNYTLRNTGTGPAHWLVISVANDATTDRWAMEPARLMRLDAGAAARLTLNIQLHPHRQNPQPFDLKLTPQLTQAYGQPQRLPVVQMRADPPNLTVQSATVEGRDAQRSLAVVLDNAGASTRQVLVTGRISDEQLPAEQALSEIPALALQTVSFGLGTAFSLPAEPRLTLSVRTAPGTWPIHDWEFADVPVKAAGLPAALWLGASALLLTLGGWLYFQRVYRHPLVVRVSADPRVLYGTDPSDLPDLRRRLQRAGRLQAVLQQTQVEAHWLDAAGRFDADPSTGVLALAKRMSVSAGTLPDNAFRLELNERFSLNLRRLVVQLTKPDEVAQDLINRWAGTGEVTLLLGGSQEQRTALAALARAQPGLLVAPDGAELSQLLLATDPLDELARLIGRHVPVTHVSPYQTGGGVGRAGMFFGRRDLIAQVMGRDPANYLVVGGRQVGKSSLLKELARRYADDPSVDVHYLVLTDHNAATPLARTLGLPDGSGLDDVARHVAAQSRRSVFVIDEVDAFAGREPGMGYPTFQRMRALSEQGKASFILAGFWSLYRHAALDYQSPLKNFGTVLTVGALEPDACLALATQPMARMGIRWADADLVQNTVEQCGRRANLIAIVCDEVLNSLGTTSRSIEAAQVQAVLLGNRVRHALEGWDDLGNSEEESRLDRCVAYAIADGNTFTLPALMADLECHGLAVDTQAVRQAVARLELAFVLCREGEIYRYQVPLQRDLIRALDPAASLQRELRQFRAD